MRASQHDIHFKTRKEVASRAPAGDAPDVDGTQRAPKESSPRAPNVAFILGMGRSGTNFLLDLIDSSPLTHCRNEPDELSGGALESWSGWKIHRSLFAAGDLSRDLREVVLCGGERDRAIPPFKSWLRSAASTPARALSRTTLRKLVPGLGSSEYHLPAALVRSEELFSALHVLKINAAPSVAEVFMSAADDHDAPEARVIHIVRNPAGFLRSWRQRWLKEHDEEQVLAANLERLEEVRHLDPEGGAFISAVPDPNVHEAELLFWRYCTQRIRAAGAGRAAYLEVSYDELARSPLASLREVFAFLDLPWTEEISARVGEMTDRSVDIATAFQAELDDEAISTFERTLGPELCKEFSLKRA